MVQIRQYRISRYETGPVPRIFQQQVSYFPNRKKNCDPKKLYETLDSFWKKLKQTIKQPKQEIKKSLHQTICLKT